MKKIFLLISMALLITTATAYADQQVPAKGMVTMADIGSTTCIPCKMMEPVLENLRTGYKGRAAIIFVDVNKDRSAAKKFGLRAIPTQVFFDKNGEEKWRHTGFLDQKSCSAKLDEIIGAK